ncbi:MAG: ATP-binding cassette domain-containing protein [Propionibacteriaceae bacterium]|nr:ATP-binding cassette domain-containing protein [Propionibacteriaceae bacterium]
MTAQNLGHWFIRGRWLFQGLDLDLRPDRVYAVTGPSGSGKSTLLSLLAGWEPPRAGMISRRDVSAVRWVFQNPVGVAGRSAIDHVALGFVARGWTRRAAETSAYELLEQFGLENVAASAFSALSGGEAQRLMLARGLASGPGLFLVDEPTAQLDRPTAAVVNSRLSALAERGVIVVIATHDLDTRAQCTDVIDLGTL